MSDSITVSGTVTFGQQYRVSRLASFRGAGRMLWGAFVGVPIIGALGLLSVGGSLTEKTSSGWPMWAILAAGPVFMLVIVPLLVARAVAQARRQNPSLCSARTYTVSREGFEVKAETFETRMQWPAIIEAVETKEFFLFFISARGAHFIPKAFLTSPNEFQDLRAIVREALGPKARLRG